MKHSITTVFQHSTAYQQARAQLEVPIQLENHPCGTTPTDTRLSNGESPLTTLPMEIWIQHILPYVESSVGLKATSRFNRDGKGPNAWKKKYQMESMVSALLQVNRATYHYFTTSWSIWCTFFRRMQGHGIVVPTRLMDRVQNSKPGNPESKAWAYYSYLERQWTIYGCAWSLYQVPSLRYTNPKSRQPKDRQTFSVDLSNYLYVDGSNGQMYPVICHLGSAPISHLPLYYVPNLLKEIEMAKTVPRSYFSYGRLVGRNAETGQFNALQEALPLLVEHGINREVIYRYIKEKRASMKTQRTDTQRKKRKREQEKREQEENKKKNKEDEWDEEEEEEEEKKQPKTKKQRKQ